MPKFDIVDVVDNKPAEGFNIADFMIEHKEILEKVTISDIERLFPLSKTIDVEAKRGKKDHNDRRGATVYLHRDCDDSKHIMIDVLKPEADSSIGKFEWSHKRLYAALSIVWAKKFKNSVPRDVNYLADGDGLVPEMGAAYKLYSVGMEFCFAEFPNEVLALSILKYRILKKKASAKGKAAEVSLDASTLLRQKHGNMTADKYYEDNNPAIKKLVEEYAKKLSAAGSKMMVRQAAWFEMLNLGEMLA